MSNIGAIGKRGMEAAGGYIAHIKDFITTMLTNTTINISLHPF